MTRKQRIARLGLCAHHEAPQSTATPRSTNHALVKFAVLFLLCAGPAAGQEPKDESIERLVTVADIWGRLYLFHPRAVGGALNFELTLVEALPHIERARSTDEFLEALNAHLLAPLDDQWVYAQKKWNVAATEAGGELAARRLSPQLGYINATNPDLVTQDDFVLSLQEQLTALGDVQTLVLDLRFTHARPVPSDWLAAFLESSAGSSHFVSRTYEGWPPETGGSVYSQSLTLRAWPSFSAAAPIGLISMPTVFLVNNSSYPPLNTQLDMLQATTRSVVVYERQGGFPLGVVQSYPEDIDVLGSNPELLLSKSGNLGARANHISLSPIADSAIVPLAERLLSAGAPPLRHPFPTDVRLPDPAPASVELLSREERLLGLFKMWTVIRHFNLHLEHASIDWATALPEWIPPVIEAETTWDYYNVLRQLAATLNDSHVNVSRPGMPLRAYVGRPIPVRLRRVEGIPVVMEVFAYPDGTVAPLRPGDEIVSIDGMPVADIEAEVRHLLSASTPASLDLKIMNYVRGSARGEVAEVVVRNDDGIRTERVRTDPTLGSPPGLPWAVLSDSIGYISLGVLEADQMEDALAAIQHTHGLILDMRGYPQFPIQRALIPRLIEEPVQTTRHEYPFVQPWWQRTIETFGWVLPDPDQRYTKPIVVLTDERAISAAEGFLMFLRNAKRGTFVGSQTAGTNGNVTSVALPGGAQIVFTGMRVKFGDGLPFQNIGILPDVHVEPTIRGVREGKDEVLLRGIEIVKSLF